jgi:hypothetical protein
MHSSIALVTTYLEVEHEHTVQGRLRDLSQTKMLKHSPSRDVQDQNIDQFDDDKGNLAARYSEPTKSPKSSTERSIDLYALRVPFNDQEGYMALFLSNETAVPFCKDISEALYDDSEKVFLHLDLRLGNSTTEVPVREDNAIGFCQKVKGKEQVGDGSSAPTRTSSRITGSPAAKESAGGNTTARLSEANKTIVSNTAKATSIEEIPKPSETTASASAKSEKLNSTAQQTKKIKSTVPHAVSTSDTEVPQLPPSPAGPSSLPISTPALKTTSFATFQNPSAKPSITQSVEIDSEDNTVPLDLNTLPDKVPSKTPSKVSESVETPKSVALTFESTPLGLMTIYPYRPGVRPKRKLDHPSL